MNKIIVVGGGASGMMAAITAARLGASVTVLEAMEKPGKKILITGNGRCNLTNLNLFGEEHYRSEYSKECQRVLEVFDQQAAISFFRELGLLTHSRNGGIYPITDQSSSVVDLLIAEARRWKVKIKCTEKVSEIRKEDNWKVQTGSWTYEADCVILACGSKSYPQTGSDGSGYALAQQLGLKIIEPLPALVPLIVKENIASKVSGTRSNAKVILKIIDGKRELSSYQEKGEVQWTDYGVSGIVIFQLSRYAVRALKEGKQPVLKIDILPDHTKDELENFLINRENTGTIQDVLTGILPKKMIPVILSLCGLKADVKYQKLTEKDIRKIVGQIKEITLTVKGSKSFDMAQVCQGGVSLKEIDSSTMEVKNFPGLYITGELLDVDGICGGYNLQWAWSTGYIAGKASAEKIL